MSRCRIHHLKITPGYFPDVRNGRKPFEVRRADRDFRPGDILVLREWDPAPGSYSGHWAARVVSFVLTADQSPGIAVGYVVLGLSISDVIPRLRNAGGPAKSDGVGLMPLETVPAPTLSDAP